MLGPFATASRLTPIHQGSLAVLSRAACASMSTTSTTTKTTTTRDRGDRYGPMEWAQKSSAITGMAEHGLGSLMWNDDRKQNTFPNANQMHHSKDLIHYLEEV